MFSFDLFFFCWQFYDALEDSDRLLASVRDLLGVDPKVCYWQDACWYFDYSEGDF